MRLTTKYYSENISDGDAALEANTLEEATKPR